MEKDIISYINKDFAVAIPSTTTQQELQDILAHRINHLIINDFSLLVHILYRIDVNEKKLEQLLKQNPDKDAAKILAALVIERQMDKIKSRQEFRRDENNFNEEEKW